MKAPMKLAALVTTLAVAPALWNCGGPEQTPENRIKQLVTAGEEAAETRDISALGDLVADDYRDERGYDRRTVLRIAQGLFLRNRDVHLFTVVRDLRVEAGTADAVVLVAMAGKPIESAEALMNLNADLVRFDVEFIREGDDWVVSAAAWRRAAVNDFL